MEARLKAENDQLRAQLKHLKGENEKLSKQVSVLQSQINTMKQKKKVKR